MNIVIIPGFIGYPEDKSCQDIKNVLTNEGHTVNIIAWPYFPYQLDKYGFTSMLAHARKEISKMNNEGLVILGISMGGIIATILADEFKPKKLVLLVSPYQAGTEDDLASKYNDWQINGYREIKSSKYGGLKIPFSFIEDARHYNALDYIQNIRCPVLFIAGEKDKNVPYFATHKLFEKTNEPKQWYLIPGMEHKFQYQTGMSEKVGGIITDFFK